MKQFTASIFLVTSLLSFGCATGMLDSSTPADNGMFNPPDRVVRGRGWHTVKIRRTYADENQAKLILMAESTMPKREDVAPCITERSRLAFDVASTEHPWWYDSFDGVFIPYAITAEGLSYYLNLSDSFRKGDFSGTRGIRMEESSLEYTAEVARYDRFDYEGKSFRNVSVVTMNLSWRQYCGNLCAMWFTKKRVVIFDEKGAVLKIFHDGATRYKVS